MELIREIARAGLVDSAKMPDENEVGRHCYALSAAEDCVIEHLTQKAHQLFERYGVPKSEYRVETDAFGNLFIYYYGKDRSKTVMSGSHVDSVKNGGMYDGPTGVVSAFRFLEFLLKSGQKPAKNYGVAAFRAEESSPTTGVACLGSAVATGRISRKDLEGTPYNGTSLKEHIIARYGPDRWEKILEECDHPPLTAKDIALYEEVHIEQSSVMQDGGKQVGIVIDGIGGSRREKYFVEAEHLETVSLSVLPETPHRTFKVEFTGQEAHTGGTPPNPTVEKRPRLPWYRHDALVAACHFAQRAIELCRENQVPVYVRSVDLPKETGFTTVPARQSLEFMVPETHTDFLEHLLHSMVLIVPERMEVEAEVSDHPTPFGDHLVMEGAQTLPLFDIPLHVELAMRNQVEEEKKLGKVRSTVTDFILDSAKGFQFNIDYRDVNTEARNRLFQTIHKHMPPVSGLALSFPLLPQKFCAAVCEAAVTTKRRIAETLGLSVCEMPSMPGHDAVNMSHAKIPVTMTFVRHDGVSHNPRETVDPQDFEAALRLSHAFLAEQLGVRYPEALQSAA